MNAVRDQPLSDEAESGTEPYLSAATNVGGHPSPFKWNTEIVRVSFPTGVAKSPP